MTDRLDSCPACRGAELTSFHTQEAIPVNSCVLLADAGEAERFPVDDLELCMCESCGFIFNRVFDASRAEYGAGYEETQGFSARFTEFATDLAHYWVDRYDLRGATVLEVGCGSGGQFLGLMAEAGIGRGIGIDPALSEATLSGPAVPGLEWIRGRFPVDYPGPVPEAIVCRHTLEHIQPVADFMAELRGAIGENRDTVVLFELPDVQRVLDEAAFWDVYYEHCSYFSAGSLARLFLRSGFEILDQRVVYDDQYLIIEATASGPSAGVVGSAEDDIDRLRSGVESYRRGFDRVVDHWRVWLAERSARGETVVVWGGGSKAVSFLTNVPDGDVSAVVDINPRKRGLYLAGTGHRHVGPEDLEEIDPDAVVVMNRVYLDEIGAELASRGIACEVVAV